MKKILFLMTAMLALTATANAQVKLQFVDLQLGLSTTAQGYGYSLFDKAVGDNNASFVAISMGWGKTNSHTTGTLLDFSTITMPNYDESASVLTLGFEMRDYTDITESFRVYSGEVLGAAYLGNAYTLNGIAETAHRWGIEAALSVGAEKRYGEHLYFGASMHLFAIYPFSASTFEPTAAVPQRSPHFIFGNKLMITAGYQL